MMMSDFSHTTITKYYSDNALELSEGYEKLSFEKIHGQWLHILPEGPLEIVDIGAGSGRDAAWFANHGNRVIAVEPSDRMRNLAGKLHLQASIVWENDSLPELAEVRRLDRRFDLVLVSAVWMHLHPSTRESAFGHMHSLLKPGGLLVVTLRNGPDLDQRMMYPASVEEITMSAIRHSCRVKAIYPSEDHLGRPGISWTTLVIVPEKTNCAATEQP
jgi:SAM-dependent methyltransferase